MAPVRKFKPEFVEQAKKLAQLGHFDLEIASFFEVAVRTLHRWKMDHPEFEKALRVGKTVADARVERSLYEAAVGYAHEEDYIAVNQKTGVPVIVPTIKHYPPNAVAGMFWLKNRQPGKWRDKQEVEHKGGITVHFDADDAAL